MSTPAPTKQSMTNAAEREPTPEEVEAVRHEHVFASGDKAEPHMYPRMFNQSAGFIYKAVIRAADPDPTEYVTLDMGQVRLDNESSLHLANSVSSWNMLWEAGQYRRRVFGEEELPPQLARIAERGDFNVLFVPRTCTRYHEYAPLFHLLPAEALRRVGLPQLTGGQWPFVTQFADVDDYLPPDFARRLERAWASAVWRHLIPGSPLSAFTGDDPIRVLAHNLDFWLPPVTQVIQGILGELPIVDKGIEDGPVVLEDGSELPGAVIGNPRMGSDLWRGETEAAEALTRVVEEADTTGRLRAILDAVRSNRVEDDFSDRWSYAREDFERKLYRKRNKVRVRFVELTDTIPVQGPDTEVENEMVFGDFLALLNQRDREIVVLLNSGTTKLTEIADILGYANHSAVSKRLARIRRLAEHVFYED
jgi:hypothetical protein